MNRFQSNQSRGNTVLDLDLKFRFKIFNLRFLILIFKMYLLKETSDIKK